MPPPPPTLAELVSAYDAIIYNTVAASMFIFWDHCITFNDEVELVWRSQWSLVSVTFVIIRYMTPINRIVELAFYTNVAGIIHPSLSQCTAWIRYEAASGQIVFFCVEILLIMRVFAFYGRKKMLLIGVLALFLAENAARIAILGLTIPKISTVPNHHIPHNLHVGACLVGSVPHLFSNYWVPGLVFETILFVLVIARFIYTKLHQDVDSPHILVVFIRDGTWAFLMIFAVLMWSTLSFELSPIKGEVALTWLYTVLGFCGSRLVLNLRSAAVDYPALTTIEDGVELHFRKSTTVDSRTSDTDFSEGKDVDSLKINA